MRNHRLEIRLDPNEFAALERYHNELQEWADKMADLNRIPPAEWPRTTLSEAARSLMFSENRHAARLVDVDVHTLAVDVSSALHAIGHDPDAIVTTVLALHKAHAHVRQVRADELGVTGSDLNYRGGKNG